MEKHLIVLGYLGKQLNCHGIAYHVTGGIAGNIHGSSWPPHDIDIEVGAKDFLKVAEFFSSAMVQAPYHHIDDEFDLWLMKLQIQGIEIDINQVENSFAITKNGRVPFSTNLKTAERHLVAGSEILVQPLEELIAYKQLIGRVADVADLSSL